jgi:hypothetical protein
LPPHPGAPPSRLRTFVAPYVIEYATREGAAAGFELLESEAPDMGMKDVPDTRVIGDRSEITRFRRSSGENGELYRALDLTFQVDNLVAGVTVGEFDGREPDLATVEAVAERLLAKVRLGQAGGGTGLSDLALRLDGPGGRNPRRRIWTYRRPDLPQLRRNSRRVCRSRRALRQCH